MSVKARGMRPLMLIALLAAVAGSALEVRVQLPEQGVDDRLKAFAARSESLVVEWEPRVAVALGVPVERRPKSVTIIFRDMKGVAYWDGKAINVATAWVAGHPDDAGLVVHELTHVLQGYRKAPGWMTEGLADYVRFQLMEKGKFGIRIDPSKNKPTDSYRVTGYFLAQAEKKYPGLIVKLNQACFEGVPVDKVFAAHCDGRSYEQAWAELVAPAKK
jgi:Peptidase of plants and bacteria